MNNTGKINRLVRLFRN